MPNPQDEILPAPQIPADNEPEPAPKNTQDELPTAQTQNTSFQIHFFDVGEADSALVECDGHYMLVDGGNPRSSQFLYAYLKEHAIDYLDYIVCSHAHADHVGGLAGALNYAKVGVAYAPVKEHDSRAFRSFVKYLELQGKAITVPSPGDQFSLGSALVTVIAPVDMEIAESNTNNSSIVLIVQYEETTVLLTGDAEKEEEATILQSGVDIRCDLLKVGDHGSGTSSSPEFLEAVAPKYCVISVGENNEYGHPSEEVLSRLSEYCNSVYRTDMDGEIVCTSDGKNLIIESEK